MIDPQYVQLANLAADKHGLPRALVNAVMSTESEGDRTAVSEAGAMGLMQLMPDTITTLKVTDPFDPAQSLSAGARYLADLLRQFPDSWEKVLAGYNAGAGYVAKKPDPSSWGADVKSYVRKVFSRWVPGSVPNFDKTLDVTIGPAQFVPQYEVVIGPATILTPRSNTGIGMGLAVVAMGALVVTLTALALTRR